MADDACAELGVEVEARPRELLLRYRPQGARVPPLRGYAAPEVDAQLLACVRSGDALPPCATASRSGKLHALQEALLLGALDAVDKLQPRSEEFRQQTLAVDLSDAEIDALCDEVIAAGGPPEAGAWLVERGAGLQKFVPAPPPPPKKSGAKGGGKGARGGKAGKGDKGGKGKAQDEAVVIDRRLALGLDILRCGAMPPGGDAPRAALCLACLADPALRQPCLEWLGESGLPVLDLPDLCASVVELCVGGKQPRWRLASAQLLAAQGTRAALLVQPLLKQEQSRGAALEVLALLPEQCPLALADQVEDLLACFDPGTRCAALHCVGKPLAQRLASSVLQRIRDEDPQVREAAAQACGRLQVPELLGALEPLLDDVPEVAAAAACALCPS